MTEQDQAQAQGEQGAAIALAEEDLPNGRFSRWSSSAWHVSSGGAARHEARCGDVVVGV